MIKESIDEEEEYNKRHEEGKKRRFEFQQKNRVQLLKEVGSIFSDISFKKQNEFSISTTYDPIEDIHWILISMCTHDGSENQYGDSIYKYFYFSEKIISSLYNDLNGLSVEGYLYKLKDFIKETKEKIIEELKSDVPDKNIDKRYVY